MIKLENISRAETLRYLGGGNAEPDKRMDDLLDFCEAELKKNVSPKYLYKKIPVDSSIIKGEDIKKHLEGCDWCYVLCATLGAEADRLIRSYSVRDMSKAVALDAMSSAAVESVCNSIEEELARAIILWRFRLSCSGSLTLKRKSDFAPTKALRLRRQSPLRLLSG